ncbi:uncharacterized protein HaLaN_31104, partial [Haematococcus lacustris]
AREAHIDVLDLGNNGMTASGGAALARLLHDKRSLKELNIYNNDIGDSVMDTLAPAINENKKLANLDLGGNNIGPAGVKVLAERGLQGLDSLRYLEMGYNPLGPDGTRTLVNAVKFDLKLETLKLGWCKVGPLGARALADLVMFNKSITTLDFRGNALGNDGVIIIARGLKSSENTRLGEIDLGFNEIKDEGACALAQHAASQAMKSNADGAPKDLKLASNYITRFGQVALSEAVDMVFEMAAGKMTT